MTSQDPYTCPRCFTKTYASDISLVGYCPACQAYSGPSPWRPEAGDERCQDCHQPSPVWWVQNEIWRAVMGGHAGIMCPTCFVVRAQDAGIGGRGAWQLYPPAA